VIGAAMFQSAFVTISSDQQIVYTQLIDNVYTPWVDAQTLDAELVERLTQIRSKLVTLLNTTPVSDTTFFALEYLVNLIDADRASYVPPAPVVSATTLVTPTPDVTIPDTTPPVVTPADDDPTPTVLVTPAPIQTTPRIDISRYQE